MRRMKNKLAPYLAFFRAGMKIEIAYKAQIVMWAVISVLEVLMVLFLYGAVYRSAEGGAGAVIGGFTFNEIIVYMITSFMFSFIMGGGDTAYNIYTDVREGTISGSLTKPVSYRLKHLSTALGALTFQSAALLLPFLTVCYAIFLSTGMLTVTPWAFASSVLAFLLFTLLAVLINDAIGYFTGMMVFFTDHLFGLNMVRNTLSGFLGGRLLPLSYMGTLGVIFSFTPFAFLNSVPVLTLMGKLSGTDVLLYLGIAVLWLIFIELSGNLAYRHGVRRLTVQGG